MEPDREPGVHRSVRIPNWTTIALVAGLILLVLVIAYFATSRNSNQDKLTTQQLAQTTQQKAPAPEKLCAGEQTYDLIKRELFRRAAQLRGSDQAAFDQLSELCGRADGKSGDGEPGRFNARGQLLRLTVARPAAWRSDRGG